LSSTLKTRLREILRRSRTLRRLVRWYRARTIADPRWGRLLEREGPAWRAALAGARGPHVLLATSLGGYWAGTTLDSLLAVALTLRGARVRVLLCDGVLPACQACETRAFLSTEAFAREGPQADLCGSCIASGRRVFAGLGLPIHRFGDFLSAGEREEAARLAREVPASRAGSLVLEGLAAGEHALAGALRFFARGSLGDEPAGEAVLRRYCEAAVLAARAAANLFARERIDCAAFHHGIYVPQGLIGEAARAGGVRVVNWNPAYRKRCFIFSHGDTYHRTLLDEPTSTWEDLPWTADMEAELLSYLESRARGSEDWIWFHDAPVDDRAAIERQLGLDPAKPVVALLTNVLWDARLHYDSNVFADLPDWLLQTVGYFARRPDLQLVIRIHPAEVRGSLPAREQAAELLRARFPSLPPNVFVVPPESRLSTYAIAAMARAVLIYGTKTGVEVAARGKPVIVAGEAWVRGKGFTRDARSIAHYFELLAELPRVEPLSGDALARARKYAYHFFFRRMIPIDCLEPTGADPPYAVRIRGLDDLRPGRQRGLDVIADGILDGTPFIYRAEEQPARQPAPAGSA
jgi:hypothetical protein